MTMTQSRMLFSFRVLTHLKILALAVICHSEEVTGGVDQTLPGCRRFF